MRPFVQGDQLVGDHLSRGTKLVGDCLSRGTKLFGDQLSIGTKFWGTICPGGPNLMGTVCPGGPNWLGTICPWGQEVGDRKSGDQMGSGPNESQPHTGFELFAQQTRIRVFKPGFQTQIFNC